MTLDIDTYYMQLALKEAQQAFEEEEVPVGAIIVHNKKIIAKAHNQTRQLKDPTAHAEMIAITQAANFLHSERLNDTSLYVTLEPCPMCAGALVWARITRLVFSITDPKAGACGTLFNIAHDKRLNHRVQIHEGILAKESKDLLQLFFQKKRRGTQAG